MTGRILAFLYPILSQLPLTQVPREVGEPELQTGVLRNTVFPCATSNQSCIRAGIVYFVILVQVVQVARLCLAALDGSAHTCFPEQRKTVGRAVCILVMQCWYIAERDGTVMQLPPKPSIIMSMTKLTRKCRPRTHQVLRLCCNKL